MCKILLEAGANPMVHDRLGRTPLFDAVQAGHVPVIVLLRRYKAT